MNFDFTDDQEQLRDATRKWVDKAYTFDRRRAITAAASSAGFSREAYAEMAGLGLAGLYVPDTHDGMGLGDRKSVV